MADQGRVTEKPDFKRAKFLFDNITAASYQGAQFRYLLATDPEFRAAAETLNRKLLDPASGITSLVPESEYPNEARPAS